ncbi:sensor domain-containing diguanylate cyclase [Kribbella shirazensis]|uniref:Diguanylate cyclase (GGDEF)-like protein n=1 Tax=Kribbella shirazensis TaxID=1105143 RepID=A0A7X5V5C4_9ACTN|nr:GGDEF domain-containing protein [Kribbella shirazensis]NIK54867.1 diguanylate cyclase (GGDEF)-like protein [Kribbella shirazensis]
MGTGAMAADDALTARIAAAMTAAQSGGHAGAAAEIEAIRTELGGVPSYTAAAVEYVRGVTAHHASDADEALRAVDACLEIARAIDEPGWEANALPIRIINLARSGRGGDTVNDLVAAESALSRTKDPGLIAWAHTGLGYAYDVLRLFELCIPHYEIATRLDADAFELTESPAIDRLNLAETYLRWAHELERLGDPLYTQEIEDRLASAAYWAREADRVVVDDESQEFWKLTARLWTAAAATAEDPAKAVAELTEIRDQISKVGETERLAIAGAYLARALRTQGKSDEAKAAADRAADDLIPLADPSTHMLVLQTRSEIDALDGTPGSVAGLAYARAVARGWWKERQRALNAVRHALTVHDLPARHDAEWHAARQDPLTGVGNRRALDERLTAARDSGRAVTLLAIDVDDLKLVNDTFGHACGDELLQVAANLLVEQARATDAVIRSGGDEFFVVLDQPDANGGAQLAERIRVAVEAIAVTTDKPWLRRLGLSLGYAATAEGLGVEQLVPQADRRLYQDKRRKRTSGNPDALSR